MKSGTVLGKGADQRRPVPRTMVLLVAVNAPLSSV